MYGCGSECGVFTRLGQGRREVASLREPFHLSSYFRGIFKIMTVILLPLTRTRHSRNFVKRKMDSVATTTQSQTIHHAYEHLGALHTFELVKLSLNLKFLGYPTNRSVQRAILEAVHSIINRPPIESCLYSAGTNASFKFRACFI